MEAYLEVALPAVGSLPVPLLLPPALLSRLGDGSLISDTTMLRVRAVHAEKPLVYSQHACKVKHVLLSVP